MFRIELVEGCRKKICTLNRLQAYSDSESEYSDYRIDPVCVCSSCVWNCEILTFIDVSHPVYYQLLILISD